MASNALADAVTGGNDDQPPADTPPADGVASYRGIVDFLTKDDEANWQRRHLLEAIRQGTDPDRFMRSLVSAMRKNPDMRELGATAAGRASIFAAATRCAELGLEPNNELGHAYLIAFKRRKGQPDEHIELQMIVGYKGYLKLAAESGNLLTIEVNPVYEHDKFSIVYGVGPDAGLRHEPELKGERGDVYCYYGVAKFHDGGYYFLHMRLDDIEERKQRSGAVAAGANTPWRTDPVAMSKKTVIRAMVPFLRLGAEQAEMLEQDEKVVDADGNFTYLDTTGEEKPPETADGDQEPEPATA